MMVWIDESGTVHENCVTFLKASDEFGELSNMCGDFPLLVNNVRIGSSEALYQACRFPNEPEWQREILEQTSPMSAKLKAKKGGRRKDHSRPDWERISSEVMWWVLCVKYAQHWRRIGSLLKSTQQRPIVEESRKDPHWGAIEDEEGNLHGRNELGRLLMKLRDVIRPAQANAMPTVPIPAIEGFLLLGERIRDVRGSN